MIILNLRDDKRALKNQFHAVRNTYLILDNENGKNFCAILRATPFLLFFNFLSVQWKSTMEGMSKFPTVIDN